MPICTCTAAQGTLRPGGKGGLSAEITRIHAEINHVPPAYVNVVSSELAGYQSTASWWCSRTVPLVPLSKPARPCLTRVTRRNG